MKRQISATFKKKIEHKYINDNLGNRHYTGKYGCAAHKICNLDNGINFILIFLN